MKRSHVFAVLATAGLMVGSQAALAQSVGCGSLPQANAAPAYTTGPGAALAAPAPTGGAPRGGGAGFSGGGRGAFGGSGAGRAGGGGAAVRDPHAAGNVDAKDLPDGENAPNNVDGNFVLGPTHPAAPDTVENASVPKGAVCIFAMESGDSKTYPGITRAPRDPNAPPQPPNSRMIPVMPAPYSRRVYVYIPKQYVAGTVAPFIVGADGPDNGLFTTLDNMIAALKLAGCALEDVFKCTVMLADMKDWPAFNLIYLEYFPASRLPARSAFGTTGLALGALVEIECLAKVPA